jgi:uncharacterized membrane protein YheB (UPF0754 family)
MAATREEIKEMRPSNCLSVIGRIVCQDLVTQEEVQEAIDAEPTQCICWQWKQEMHKCLRDLIYTENMTEGEKLDDRIAREVKKEILEMKCLRFRWA